MKSFRIVDTRFRILKGGKIGLSMSVAMIGGMLSLGSTSAHANTVYDASDTGSTYQFITGEITSASSSTWTNGSDTNFDLTPGNTTVVRSNYLGAGTLTLTNSNSTINGITLSTAENGNMSSLYFANQVTVGVHNGWTGSSWDYDSDSGDIVSVTIGNAITTTHYIDSWTATINLTNMLVNAQGSPYAIETQDISDDFTAASTLNLYSTNTINGMTLVSTTNLISGTTTFNGSLYSPLAMASGTTANFTSAATQIVGAISGGVNGTINAMGNNTFTNTVDVGTINLGGNDITFNDNVDATMNFTAAGETTFANGADLTGNVSFGSHNATLTLSSGSNVTGSVTGTGTDNGTLNFEGSSVVSGNVGLIKEINVGGNTSNVQLNTTSGNTTVNALNINADLANVEVDGLLSANTVSMGGHYSKLELLDRSNTSAVSSVVSNASTGAQTAASFYKDGMVGTLDFGTYNATINVPATGTQGKGTLEIGDNVDVTFSTNPAAGINAVNANNATLVFAGSSTVGGNVGTSHTSSNTFNQIWAGATGEIVTFANDVYVGVDAATATTAGSLSTTSTHKLTTGSGTVNLNGNLYGNLVIGASTTPVSVQGTAYSSYGDAAIGGTWTIGGTVNVAHNKTVEGSITTALNGTGTLNFMGSSAYGADIGTSGAKLAAVTFNSASVGNGTVVGNATNSFTETIGNNIYATTVTIGNSGETTTTAKPTSLVDATGSYDYAGATNMQVWTGGTVANIASGVTSLGDALVLNNARDAINFGTAHIAATSFTTNGGAMSFTVNTNDITTNAAASTSTGSGQVAVTTLNMNNAEKIQINYVGSLRDAGIYNLITATAGVSTYGGVEGDGKVFDNSYVIDTSIAKVANGNLILSADRTANAEYASNQLYVEKSNTVGHFSNNAAEVLAGIAAVGDQTGDMVQVIQKMEIDSFGFGNNAENLAVQSKRLAPVVNASLSQSAIGANTLTLNTVSNRIADLRGDSVILPRAGVTGMSAGDETAAVKGVWAKVIAATATQEKDGMYDGYKTRSAGLAMGIDREFKYDITAGLAFGYTRTNVDQQDFRSGDEANTDSYNLVAYASKNFERAYVEGALSYALHNTDSTRATAVGRTATADIDADQYTAHISGGYRFNIKDRATVTPFLTLDYTHLAQDGYTETGADAINLKVDEMSTNRTTIGGGFRVGTTVEKGSAVLRPELKLAAYHISGSSNTDITAQYVGGGEKFVTPGTDLSSMMYNVGLGLKAETSKSTSLGVSIDYDRSSDGLFQGYTGQLVARYEF